MIDMRVTAYDSRPTAIEMRSARRADFQLDAGCRAPEYAPPRLAGGRRRA